MSDVLSEARSLRGYWFEGIEEKRFDATFIRWELLIVLQG